MGRTVWDDIAEAPPGDEASTRVRSPASTPSGEIAPKRWTSLPWLLCALTGTGLAASIASNLDERAHTKHALSTSRDESADLRRTLFATQDRLATDENDRSKQAQTAAQLRAKTDENDKLIADLKKELDSKDGDVSTDANRISVNLVDQILFKSGEAEISARGKEVLTKVGGVLKGLTDKQILIGGHTDQVPIHTPQFPSNWELSAARAVNVVHFLAETVGVDPARLTAAGYSEFHPRSKKDKAKNRRIEILLTPTVEVKKS
jgi:chemotaxis protein MotB